MIATSYWQSLELLRVGLDRETADFYYAEIPGGKKALNWRGKVVYPLIPIEIPSWSLSALWDIVHNIDKTYEYDTKMSAQELLDTLVSTICYRLKER